MAAKALGCKPTSACDDEASYGIVLCRTGSNLQHAPHCDRVRENGRLRVLRLSELLLQSMLSSCTARRQTTHHWATGDHRGEREPQRGIDLPKKHENTLLFRSHTSSNTSRAG
jgi:hypothetical protein